MTSTVPLSLSAHLAAAVEKRLSHLRENAEGVAGSTSIDAVHDLRVASRRLRAFLDVFGKTMDADVRDAARKPLRRLTKAMGPLRDADVLGLLLSEHAAKNDAELWRAAIEYVAVHLHRVREDARKEAREKLERIDLAHVEQKVRVALEDLLELVPATPFETSRFAAPLILHFAEAVEVAAVQASTKAPDDLHGLRIAAKRLRYAVELCQPTLGADYKKLHKEIEAVQENLGNHHDAHVLGALVDERLETLRETGAPTLTLGVERYRAFLAEEEAKALATFERLGFDAPTFRARLEAALGANAR